MGFEAMRVEFDQGVARLTFTDTARGNPIDGRFCDEICEAAIQLSEDDRVRSVLVSAEGDAFSYGGDINSFVAALDALPLNIKRWTTTLHSAIARLQRMDAPMIAAVHGLCVGGMSAFVAGCDILVAADNAQFGAAYTGIGFNNDAGASIMYTRRMGLSKARKFLLLNESLKADAAREVGLVDEVVPADKLIERAEQIAVQLANGPTKAYGEVRRLMTSVEDLPLEAQLELEAQALSRTAATHDAREGLTAFVEKRKPVFLGR